MKYILLALLSLPLAACSSANRLGGATGEGFGRSPETPILVGGLSGQSGPASERAYLDRLRGPNGEAVTYERNGSCCPFPTENSPFGDAGLLDVYEVRYEGARRPIILYLNMYDPAPDTLRAPEGFILK